MAWPVMLSQALVLFACLLGVYYPIVLLTRVFFQPLSRRIPGPKFPVIGPLYKLYCYLFQCGRAAFRINQWHRQYGPIVRIDTNEVHINDPDYYDTLYGTNPDLDKPMVGFVKDTPPGMFSAASFALHQRRRRPYSPLFGRAAVLKKEWLIRSRVERFSEILSKSLDSSAAVDLTAYYRALTVDVISNYAFGKSTEMLEKPLEESEAIFDRIRATWRQFSLVQISPLVHKAWRAYITFCVHVLIPLGLHSRDPNASSGRAVLQVEIERLVDFAVTQETSSGSKSSTDEITHKPALNEVMRSSKLDPRDATKAHFMANGSTLYVAGSDTTAANLGVGSFHILANKDVLERLKSEIKTVWPDASSEIPAWTTLERLEYLQACVQETKRISLGVSRPFPRVNHVADMRYKDYVIPKGTTISMSHQDLLYNPDIFPDPLKFDPDRWMKGPEETARLQKYNVVFSRGARQCLAYDVAHCELYLTLATMIRRFDLELVNTTREDVDFYYDFVLPFPKSGKHKVMVKGKSIGQ